MQDQNPMKNSADNENKITAIIKTFNSERTLYNTLESIKELDEIFVIDENSTDDTVEIAKEYRAKIIFSPKTKLLPSLNQAVEEAAGEWIFVVKDNEIIPQKLIYEIKKYINSPKKNKTSLTVPSKTFYFNREIKYLSEKKLLRIFRKGSCTFFDDFSADIKLKEGKIHNINSNFKSKNCYILSYFENDVSKSLINILEKNKHDFKTLKSNKVSLFFKPLAGFFINFFIKRGILDGKFGYVLCVHKFIEDFTMQMMIMNENLKGNKDDI